jgi:hypothetical protein
LRRPFSPDALLTIPSDIIQAITTARKSEQPSQEDIEEIIAEVSIFILFSLLFIDLICCVAQIETQHKGCCIAAFFFTTKLSACLLLSCALLSVCLCRVAQFLEKNILFFYC